MMTASLYLHARKIESIFELLGESENDITYSIGWTLSNSPAFLYEFQRNIVPNLAKKDAASDVYLQEFKHDSGITDIEIRGNDLHIIIEAKRGWILPEKDQLRQYTRRLHKSPFNTKRLVVMSECSSDYAKQHLPRAIKGIRLDHVSWKEIDRIAGNTRKRSNAEKMLVAELQTYLRRVVRMQKQESNMAYCVVLSSDQIDDATITWQEVVTKKKKYFHPYDKNWPQDPPNYIAFRYDGKLQSVHHVDSWDIVDSLHDKIREISKRHKRPHKHIVYNLGKPMVPAQDVKNGRIWPNARYWVMIDLLLTSKTIAEAIKATNKRIQDAPHN